jgi:hypothetical protein
MTPAERNEKSNRLIEQFSAGEIADSALWYGLEDLGWHPAAIDQALDDLKAQQILDAVDDE